MAKSNKAHEIVWPTDSNILVRVVFLYVGQGSSVIVLMADGETYKTLLVDINMDEKAEGIHVPNLVNDLLDGNSLHAFVNTHPHDDHLHGLADLSEKVDVDEVWHSGHKPSKTHGNYYSDLEALIKKVKKAGGKEIILEGSKTAENLGDASYHVLAPAEYIADEINDEDADTRYNRIHEQCAVLKFGSNSDWIIIPGDADRDAFEKHITKYHKDRLSSHVLAASHHGSRSFFRYDKKDDAYTDALKAIDPVYVLISAPKRSESRHAHPHQDAIDQYTDHVGSGNVLYGGENRYSFICDIYRNGGYSGIEDDQGDLAKDYPINESGDDGDNSGTKSKVKPTIAASVARHTRIDERPMGEC